MLEEGEQKQAFYALQKKKRAHYVLLENVIEYISTPQTWVESAEFNHLSEKFVQKTTL